MWTVTGVRPCTEAKLTRGQWVAPGQWVVPGSCEQALSLQSDWPTYHEYLSLSVINSPSIRNAFIWVVECWPFRSFQNNFSLDSAATHNFVILSASILFKNCVEVSDSPCASSNNYHGHAAPNWKIHESKAFLKQKLAALTSSGSLVYVARLPWRLQLALCVTSGREQSTISFVILSVDFWNVIWIIMISYC